jgi:hypothetical protein
MKSNLNEMTIFLLFILLFESTTTKNLNQINENLVLSIKDHKVTLHLFRKETKLFLSI